jgi:hypothetical protein
MKLFAKSKNGKMLKVGDTAEDSKWYFMTEDVIKWIATHSIKAGDIITIATKKDQGSDFITSINVGNSAPQTTSTPTVPLQATGSTLNNGNDFGKKPWLPKDEWIAKMKAEGKWTGGDGSASDKPQSKSWSKSPEEQNTIKRQAIGHMTSRTLISMQGIITPDNVLEMIEKLYNKYTELIG